MKTALALLLGALVGAVAVWVFRLQPSVYMFRNPQRGITIGSYAFLTKQDCEALAGTGSWKGKTECVAVDENRAMVLALAAVSNIQPECNCDCSR